MKFTITRINKQNKLMVSSKTVERFLERIAKDDAKLSVTNFRMSVPLMEADYQYYKGIKEWQHVYPAAEFNKDESGNLVFQKSNGLVMLHFINLMSDQEKDAVKKTVSLLPMTFAAFEGADGRSLIVLVSICNEEGKIPTKEANADLLYQSASNRQRHSTSRRYRQPSNPKNHHCHPTSCLRWMPLLIITARLWRCASPKT